VQQVRKKKVFGKMIKGLTGLDNSHSLSPNKRISEYKSIMFPLRLERKNMAKSSNDILYYSLYRSL
jgi:hypothetical protein